MPITTKTVPVIRRASAVMGKPSNCCLICVDMTIAMLPAMRRIKTQKKLQIHFSILMMLASIPMMQHSNDACRGLMAAA